MVHNLNVLEGSFPNAVGLTYKDPDDEYPILILQREGKFVVPASGWSHEGRVYTVEETEAVSSTRSSSKNNI